MKNFAGEMTEAQIYKKALDDICYIIDKPSMTFHEKALRMGDVANQALMGRGGPGSWRLEWSDEWPTVAGRYWFYGKRSEHAQKDELHMVHCRKISNGFLYVTDNVPISRGEGAEGQWLQMFEPELPGTESK